MLDNNFKFDKQQIKEYFSNINREITIKIDKKHEKSKPSDFDVEIIVRSLLKFGIPLVEVFQILDKIKEEIQKNYPPDSIVDSKDLIDIVVNAIISLENNEKILWASKFNKMFDRKKDEYLKLEDENGQTLEDLTSKKIRILIVNKLSNLLPKTKDEIKQSFKKDLPSWSKEVFDIIKSMGILSIRTRTLEDIIEDLAFKSYKPWISGIKLDTDEINERIEGIDRQIKNIEFYNKTNKIDKAKMHSIEVLDDISELILNKYEILYDGSLKKPFNKLHNLIINSINNKDTTNFTEFNEDIEQFNYSINEINELCYSFKGNCIETYSPDDFDEIINRLMIFFNIGKKIYINSNLNQLWDNCLDPENHVDLDKNLTILLREIIKESNDFSILNSFTDAMILEPNGGSPIINAFGDKIYCRIFSLDKTLNIKDIFEFLGNFHSDIEKSGISCEIGLSFSINGVDKKEYKIFEKSNSSKLIIFFDLNDIESLIQFPGKFQKLVDERLSKYLECKKSIKSPNIKENVPIFEKKDIIKAWEKIEVEQFAEAGSLCISIIESFVLDYLVYILKIIHEDNWLEKSKIYSSKKQTVKKWTFGEIINVLSTKDFEVTFKENASKLYTGIELKGKILTENEKNYAKSISRIRSDCLAHKDSNPIDGNKIHRLWLDTQELINSISKKRFFPLIIYTHKTENNQILAVNQYGKKVIINFENHSHVLNGNLYFLIPKEQSEEKTYIYIKDAYFIKYGIICQNCKEYELYLGDLYCKNCDGKIKIPRNLKDYIHDSETIISEFIKLEDIILHKPIELESYSSLPELKTEIILNENEKKLIKTMFPDFQTIFLVNEFTSGFSQTRVIKVKPKDKNGEFQIPQTIKIGPSNQIQDEISNYNSFVCNYLNKGDHAEITSHKSSNDLGSICYHFVGREFYHLISLGEYYERHTISEIMDLLSQLYNETLFNWYKNRKLDEINLYNEYVKPLIDNEKIYDFEKEMQNNGDDKIFIKELNKYYISPLTLLNKLDHNLWKQTYISTIHGDLNSNNIQIEDKNKIWLIDFYSTKKNHLIRDFTKLETVIKFELMKKTDLHSFLNLENILINNLKLENELLIDTMFDADLKNAFSCIKIIRENLTKLYDIKSNYLQEYLISLLYYTLKTLTWDNVDHTDKKYAFYSASLIADKINEKK